MGISSAEKMQRHRARERRDEVLVTICANRILLVDTLRDSKIPIADDDGAALARGLERLLEKLQEKIL
jgi:hypothetical protein